MKETLRILKDHGMQTQTTKEGHILAFEVATQTISGKITDASRWIDVTGWSLKKLFLWLGY